MPLKGVRFLLVEDDDVDVMILKRAFEDLNILNPVVVANDGIEALDILRGTGGKSLLKKPYIILLDLNMPRMGGLEFLRIIRDDPELKRTVVFILTTSNDDKDKFMAYDQNVAGYILKSNPGETFSKALEMLDCYWRIVELPIE